MRNLSRQAPQARFQRCQRQIKRRARTKRQSYSSEKLWHCRSLVTPLTAFLFVYKILFAFDSLNLEIDSTYSYIYVYVGSYIVVNGRLHHSHSWMNAWSVDVHVDHTVYTYPLICRRVFAGSGARIRIIGASGN